MSRATAGRIRSVDQLRPMPNPSEFTPLLVMNPRDRRSPHTVHIALGGVECFARNRSSHIMKLTTAHNVLDKLTTAHNVLGNRPRNGWQSNYSAHLFLVCICVIHEVAEVGAAHGRGGVGEHSTSVRARRGAPPAEGVRRPERGWLPGPPSRRGQRTQRVPADNCDTRVSPKAADPAVIRCGPVRS